MVFYVNSSSPTLPNTIDGSPARSIVPNHQLHVAGEEGGSATMVAVFCRFFSVVLVVSYLSYVKKWYETAVRPSFNYVTFCPTLACTTPYRNGAGSYSRPSILGGEIPLFFSSTVH
jgi:hypothetical protein